MSRRNFFTVLLTLLCCLTTQPVWGIINGEPPTEDDRRFDAVCAFSYRKWIEPRPKPNPNTQGQTSENNVAKKTQPRNAWFGAATLVSPDLIVTARHLLSKGRAPRPGVMAVRFRRKLDGSLGSKEAGEGSYFHVRIKGWKLIDGADLAVGQLVHPVTHIQPIPIDFDVEPFERRPGYVAGWGSESNWVGQAQPRRQLMIGKTTLTRTAASNAVRIDEFKTEARDWRKDKQTGQWIKKPYVISEAGAPNMHDSGGAMLIEDDKGQLKIIGVISSYGGGSWLGKYRGQPETRLPGAEFDESKPAQQSTQSSNDAKTDK